MTNSTFDEKKAEILEFKDKSPKGSIDEPVIPLLETINRTSDLVTTSSCSGRVAVYIDADRVTFQKVKKGGIWCFVTHDPIPKIPSEELGQMLFSEPLKYSFGCSPGDCSYDADLPIVYFKFEPLILHVLARDESSASKFLACSIRAGYANSGIQGLHVQVRSTLKLDIPIGVFRNNEVQLFVSQEYLQFIVALANGKFAENFERSEKLRSQIDIDYTSQTTAIDLSSIKEERRLRKRREGLERAAALKGDVVV
ncbi:tRNA wybutosine-synthesizing protein [Phlyctochytrium arcticum]|nr:tRNA wybutosine-synthesizing protein [Phlyctochytrium arcticum]